MTRLLGAMLRVMVQLLVLTLLVGGALYWLSHDRQGAPGQTTEAPGQARDEPAPEIAWRPETVAALLGPWCSVPGQAHFGDARLSFEREGARLFIESGLPIPARIRRSPFEALVLDGREVLIAERARGYVFVPELSGGVLSVTIRDQPRRTPSLEGRVFYRHMFQRC